MNQERIIDYPPLFDEIDAAFHVRGKDVVFAFGDRIFNPKGVDIPPQILVHERVHGLRQGSNVLDWWKRYIADPAFRVAEEIPAHQAEYRWMLANAPRYARRAALKQIAGRLSGPLYGQVVSMQRAKLLLRAAA